MMITLTHLSNGIKLGLDLTKISIIEEYGNNTSRITLNNSNGHFDKHVFARESVENICEIVNGLISENNHHKITIYHKKSKFDS